MNRHGAQGMPQVLPTNGFNNMVNAAIVCQFVYPFSPVAFKPVDAIIGAELFGPRQFFIASRRDKNLRPLRFGNLQSEYRHTARALHQHRLSGAQMTALHQREPCGKPGAG